MAEYVFRTPDVGEGVVEAEIVAWHVKPGDVVAEDQPPVDLMTDKATVEITSPTDGRLVSAAGEPGAKIAVGSVLAVLDVGADTTASSPAPARPGAAGGPAPTPPAPVEAAQAAVAAAPAPTAARPSITRTGVTAPLASPAVR